MTELGPNVQQILLEPDQHHPVQHHVQQEYSLDPCHELLMSVNHSEGEQLDVYLMLDTCFGPQRLPVLYLWSLTISYLAMCITGTFGNVMVCLVIARNISMKTSTNFFLFSLAVADIAILLMGATFDLSVYWQQYPWLLGEAACKMRALLSEMTSYCSVLTILSFSCERYLAICHPLYSYTMAGTKRTTRIILCLWCVSGLAATPFAYFTKINYMKHPVTQEDVLESAFCGMLESPAYLYETSSLIFFVLPLLAIMVLYIRMGIKIQEATSQNLGRNLRRVSRAGVAGGGKKSVLQMLAAVVLSFFICWAPFHTQRLCYVFVVQYKWNIMSEETYYTINEKMFYITGILYYLSSTLNPILYNVMSAKYRKAFKQTLLSSCFKRTRTEANSQRLEQTCSFTSPSPRSGQMYSMVPLAHRYNGVGASSTTLFSGEEKFNGNMVFSLINQAGCEVSRTNTNILQEIPEVMELPPLSPASDSQQQKAASPSSYSECNMAEELAECGSQQQLEESVTGGHLGAGLGTHKVCESGGDVDHNEHDGVEYELKHLNLRATRSLTMETFKIIDCHLFYKNKDNGASMGNML